MPLVFSCLIVLASPSICRAENQPIYWKPQIEIPFVGNKYLDFQAEKGIEVNGKLLGRYISAIYIYATGVVGILAVVVLMVAGFIRLTAGGDAGRVKQANEYVSGAITGILLLFFSYTILELVNPDLVQLKNLDIAEIRVTGTANSGMANGSSGGGQGGSVAGGSGSGGWGDETYSSNTGNFLNDPKYARYTHDASTEILSANQIRVLVASNNASVDGLSKEIIDEIIALRNTYPGNLSPGTTPFSITSGTDGNHTDPSAANSNCAHSNGCKVDLRLNDALNNHIETNFTSVGTRRDGAIMYQREGGGCYAKETSHWDITPRACPPAR